MAVSDRALLLNAPLAAKTRQERSENFIGGLAVALAHFGGFSPRTGH
jgi:hypothetical protein